MFGELFRVLDLAGVFTNAILGGMVARDKRLDPVGFAALALLSGLGGGVIRDTLLQHGPPVALTDSLYALTAIAGAAVAFVLPVRGRAWNVSFLLIDALALGCWATVGTQKTLSLGLGWLPALLLGTITAVGGGALRDLFVLRIPQIFGGNTLYASCAIMASAVVIAFWYAGQPTAGALVGTAVGAAMCVLARWRRWQLGEGLAWDYVVERLPGQRLPRVTVRIARRRGE
ncbi:membrane protein [Mycolicibacterium canariasense]|uniref:Membrane protein n=1 Tax=Mycolicibacterium canariasense TaxID=228230 RepID=A0A117I8I1_MYCCR|nr:TRIC cation channel family protein [Mycolicibacterium canariasense]GAS93257.1 membrane protein [Mycolicibacterium canariasense]